MPSALSPLRHARVLNLNFRDYILGRPANTVEITPQMPPQIECFCWAGFVGTSIEASLDGNQPLRPPWSGNMFGGVN